MQRYQRIKLGDEIKKYIIESQPFIKENDYRQAEIMYRHRVEKMTHGDQFDQILQDYNDQLSELNDHTL